MLSLLKLFLIHILQWRKPWSKQMSFDLLCKVFFLLFFFVFFKFLQRFFKRHVHLLWSLEDFDIHLSLFYFHRKMFINYSSSYLESFVNVQRHVDCIRSIESNSNRNLLSILLVFFHWWTLKIYFLNSPELMKALLKFKFLLNRQRCCTWSMQHAVDPTSTVILYIDVEVDCWC